MSYLFLGDTHGDLQFVERAIDLAAEHDAEIIQVGDWGFVWPGHDRVTDLHDALDRKHRVMRFLDGNHDDHPRLGVFTPLPLLAYQPRGSVYQDHDGTRFLFFGGAASIDHAHRVPGRSWWPEEMPTDEEFQRAMDAAGPIHVLVTHDAPDYPPGFTPAGDPAFRKRSAECMSMVRRIQERHMPALHVHGHWHKRYTRTVGPTRIVGLDCNFGTLGDATLLWKWEP